MNRLFRPWQDMSLLRKDPTAEGKVKYSYFSALSLIDNLVNHLPDLKSNRQLILDLGCGYGGLAMVLAEKYQHRIVGVDSNGQGLEANQKYQQEKKPVNPKIDLIMADAEKLPFGPRKFDLIYSISTMEHFADPQRVLSECARTLRQGGQVFLKFSPYFAFNGAHLFDFIKIPWCHLFFSEKTLVKAWKILSVDCPEMAKLNTSVDSESEKLIGINRITLKRFKQTVKNSGFRMIKYEVNTFNRWYLKLLKKIPVINEAIVTDVVSILEK